MRGVTTKMVSLELEKFVSTHTPHARRDLIVDLSMLKYLKVSTHTPHARRDLQILQELLTSSRVSTHTPHARRDAIFCTVEVVHDVSTHTPHARRDIYQNAPKTAPEGFNSHASCEA